MSKLEAVSACMLIKFSDLKDTTMNHSEKEAY